MLLVGVEEAGGCSVVVADFEDGGASAGYDGVGGGDGFRGCGGGCYGLVQRSVSCTLPQTRKLGRKVEDGDEGGDWDGSLRTTVVVAAKNSF